MARMLALRVLMSPSVWPLGRGAPRGAGGACSRSAPKAFETLSLFYTLDTLLCGLALVYFVTEKRCIQGQPSLMATSKPYLTVWMSGLCKTSLGLGSPCSAVRRR